MPTYHGVICKSCKKNITLGLYKPFRAGDRVVQFVSIPGAQMDVRCPECEHANLYKSQELVQYEAASR